MSLSCDSCGFQGPQNRVACLYIGAGAAARSEDKGGFWNGSDVDAHAVNTWKSVVAFGYVWIRILSVFFFGTEAFGVSRPRPHDAKPRPNAKGQRPW